MTACSLSGCELSAAVRGYCKRHYIAAVRAGTISRKMNKGGERRAFVDAAVNSDTDACLIWPYLKSGGYGKAPLDEFSGWAHRQVCRRVHGEPPFQDAEAAHSCGNRACLNPRHLRWASHKENAQDWYEQSTWGTGLGPVRGEKHPWAKLNSDQVREIKASAQTHVALAKQFGVSPKSIRKIRIGQCWWHVT